MCIFAMQCLSPISYCSTRGTTRSASCWRVTNTRMSISTWLSRRWKCGASSARKSPSGTRFRHWFIPSGSPENNAVLRKPQGIRHGLLRVYGWRVYHRKPSLRDPSHRKRRAPPSYVAEGGHRFPVVYPPAVNPRQVMPYTWRFRKNCTVRRTI